MSRLFEQLQKAAQARERQRAPHVEEQAELPAANDAEASPPPPQPQAEPAADAREKRRDLAPHIKGLLLMVGLALAAVLWYYAAYAPTPPERPAKPGALKMDPKLDMKRTK